MTANPICRRPSTVRSTQTTQTAAIDPVLREQGERLLRDLAFVLHLTRKVKGEILGEQPAEEEALTLAGVGPMTAAEIETRLCALGDEAIAQVLRRFFKTGPGEYGEGDTFVGIKVPPLRRLSREWQQLDLDDETLLRSPIHEGRMLALLILVRQFGRGDEDHKKRIYDLYLKNTTHISNWDLVDCSAEHIVGGYLASRSRKPLDQLAGSSLVWERRIAILATFHFIKRGEFRATLRIARLLLEDRHDLIHKAVGWMLREVGKRDSVTEEEFLRINYGRMPRTMLRYAIERLPEERRQQYLKGTLPPAEIRPAGAAPQAEARQEMDQP